MEGCLYMLSRCLWTPCHILWIMQLPSHIPSYDEWNLDDIVAVYIVDILIFTKTDNLEKHNEIVWEVLWKLEENHLFIKLEKCLFHTKEIEFLGIVISPDGIKMGMNKVQVILQWPEPTTIKGVRSFLGLVNFYHQFI